MTRSRTVERRKIRQQRRRRQRLIALGVAAAVVVGVIIALVVISNQPAEAPMSASSVARYADVPQNQTQEGFPRLGNPGAPVQVAFYCNYDSDDCRTFYEQIIDPIVERVRAGDISFAYVPLYGGAGNSEGAARAAVCAAAQDKFWELHDAFFLWLQTYGAVQAFSNNRIVSGLDKLGVNRAEFDACIRSDRPAEVINEGVRDVNGLINAGTTPIITINGVVPVDDAGAKIMLVNALLEAIDRAAAIGSDGAEATAEATEASNEQ